MLAQKLSMTPMALKAEQESLEQGTESLTEDENVSSPISLKSSVFPCPREGSVCASSVVISFQSVVIQLFPQKTGRKCIYNNNNINN